MRLLESTYCPIEEITIGRLICSSKSGKFYEAKKKNETRRNSFFDDEEEPEDQYNLIVKVSFSPKEAKNEIKLLSSLSHKNILKYKGWSKSEKEIMIIFERERERLPEREKERRKEKRREREREFQREKDSAFELIHDMEEARESQSKLVRDLEQEKALERQREISLLDLRDKNKELTELDTKRLVKQMINIICWLHKKRIAHLNLKLESFIVCFNPNCICLDLSSKDPSLSSSFSSLNGSNTPKICLQCAVVKLVNFQKAKKFHLPNSLRKSGNHFSSSRNNSFDYDFDIDFHTHYHTSDPDSNSDQEEEDLSDEDSDDSPSLSPLSQSPSVSSSFPLSPTGVSSPSLSSPTKNFSPFIRILQNSDVYTSPEYFNSRYIGPEVDMWALGVIIHNLLTGSFPSLTDSLSSSTNSIYSTSLSHSYSTPNNHIVSLTSSLPTNGFSTASSPSLHASISSGASDLLSILLSRDPTPRYTSSAIENHYWLSEISNQNNPLKNSIGNISSPLLQQQKNTSPSKTLVHNNSGLFGSPSNHRPPEYSVFFQRRRDSDDD